MDHSAVETFYRAMAPTLFANILTVALVYAFVSYSKKEKTGEEIGRSTLIGLMIFVGFMLLYGLYVSGFYLPTKPGAA